MQSPALSICTCLRKLAIARSYFFNLQDLTFFVSFWLYRFYYKRICTKTAGLHFYIQIKRYIQYINLILCDILVSVAKNQLNIIPGGMAESVDAVDLKSADRKVVGVQVSLPPLLAARRRL